MPPSEAPRVICQFEDVQSHDLVAEGQATVVPTTALIRLRRWVLRLLGISGADSG